MVLNGHAFPTIERLDHRVYLRPGDYLCLHDNTKSKPKCLRPQHSVVNNKGKPAAILIHVANKPHQIEGCIAPGLKRASFGVDESRKAIDLIFELLGGFQVGRQCRLKVVGDLYA
jgi:hypothetical protein